VPCY